MLLLQNEMEWVDRVFLDHRDHDDDDDDLAESQVFHVQNCLSLVPSPGESIVLELLRTQLS
jgi:hypothetical protein